MKKNRVCLIGYVGQHLSAKQLKNGVIRIGIRMATHHQYINDKGKEVNTTTWHDVVAWNGAAKYAERNFVKGSKIMVEGCIEYRVFPGRDGNKKYFTRIKAEGLMNLDR